VPTGEVVTTVVVAARGADDTDAHAADAGTGAGALAEASAWSRATAWVAGGAVVLVGVDEPVAAGVSVALAAALLVLPVWLPTAWAHPTARLVAVIGGVAAVSGVVLGELSERNHTISATLRVQELGLLVSGVAAVCLLVWARSLLPLNRVVILYGAGGIAGAFATGQTSWKYHLAVPTTLLVLGIVERGRSRVAPAVAVLALGLVGVIFEGRSFFAACVLAATLTVWQLRPRPADEGARPRSRLFQLMLLAGVGGAVFLVLQALLTGGAFGEELQDRSIAQIEASGSLLAGGRPEWAATRELVALNSAGYGAGVVPNWADRTAGKSGLARINVDDSAFGYADHYMFGGQFRLHSVVAGLWASYGWAGVALGALIAGAIVRSLNAALAERAAPASVLLACSLALWYLPFGPIFSDWLDVCVALGLVLPLTPARRP
jgi:hypothetical protein